MSEIESFPTAVGIMKKYDGYRFRLYVAPDAYGEGYTDEDLPRMTAALVAAIETQFPGIEVIETRDTWLLGPTDEQGQPVWEIERWFDQHWCEIVADALNESNNG
jgi:hypothetical protein